MQEADIFPKQENLTANEINLKSFKTTACR